MTVSVGDLLPSLEVPITRTLIVSGAIASRDYQDVHHDPVLARQRGSKDIFMNILTTNGLVGRFVTDWAGPDAVLTRVSIRLGAPNYPDDTMTMEGEVNGVAEIDPAEASRERRVAVTVAVRGSNALGDHVTGTVELSLPMESPPTEQGGS